MDRRILSTCICALTLSICFGVHADKIYRWTDKDGNVHYSSTPPDTTVSNAQKVDVSAPQVVTVVIPAMPKALPQAQRPAANNGIDKAKAETIDKQIRRDYCVDLRQQMDDLVSGVSPNPFTHTNLTEAERESRERTLRGLIQTGCPGDG